MKHEESKSSDLFDGLNEGSHNESPVALLSAMDLNCDDDTTNSMLVIDGDESTQGPKKQGASQTSKPTTYTQSILSKLPFSKKEAKKAMVVEDDDEECRDQDGEM